MDGYVCSVYCQIQIKLYFIHSCDICIGFVCLSLNTTEARAKDWLTAFFYTVYMVRFQITDLSYFLWQNAAELWKVSLFIHISIDTDLDSLSLIRYTYYILYSFIHRLLSSVVFIVLRPDMKSNNSTSALFLKQQQMTYLNGIIWFPR